MLPEFLHVYARARARGAHASGILRCPKPIRACEALTDNIRPRFFRDRCEGLTSCDLAANRINTEFIEDGAGCGGGGHDWPLYETSAAYRKF